MIKIKKIKKVTHVTPRVTEIQAKSLDNRSNITPTWKCSGLKPMATQSKRRTIGQVFLETGCKVDTICGSSWVYLMMELNSLVIN